MAPRLVKMGHKGFVQQVSYGTEGKPSLYMYKPYQLLDMAKHCALKADGSPVSLMQFDGWVDGHPRNLSKL